MKKNQKDSKTTTSRDYKRNHNNRRSKSSYDKGTSFEDVSQGSKNGCNDLQWYVVDEQILNDAARIPYSIPVGMPLSRFPKFTNPSCVYQAYDDAVPGVLVSHVMPILGNAHDAADPVNVAANSIYQFVRSRISGSRTYDAVDFMIYLGAMDSIFSYCTWLTRLYGTVFTYHQANRYLSRALIEAQGIDYDDFVSNLSDFRAGFNVRIAKIQSLFVPSNMSIFKRHSWMFANYYIEGMTEKDQIYCHMPDGIFHFEYDSDGAGMLRARPLDITSGRLTVQNLFNILDYMINPVYADEDFNKISGDLLNAYEGSVFTITEIPDIATVQLQYNEEVLLQFKNAKYMHINRDGDVYMYNAHNYVQDSSKLYLQYTMPETAYRNIRKLNTGTNPSIVVPDSDPGAARISWETYSIKMGDWSKATLLTSPHKDVLPGENMINTRLTPTFDVVPDDTSDWKGKVNDFAVGTEWPDRFSIYTFHRNRSTGAITLFHRIYEFACYCNTGVYAEIQQILESQLPILSAFKYHPEVFIATILQVNNVDTLHDPGRSVFDVDNYALVDYSAIKGLHTAAILGQYNVPKLSVGR